MTYMYEPTSMSRKMRLLSQFIVFTLLAGLCLTVHGRELDVAYVTTPEEVIALMLDQANVGLGDYVIDLGTGDGRIVLAAVRRGATGLGIDLDPRRIREARKNAAAAGLSGRVMFREQDLFDTDISQASVVTLFLNEQVNLRLRDRLLASLAPGTRVVSHNFEMGNWQPDKHQGIMVANGPNYYLHDVFTWIIPARLGGEWQWEINGTAFHMSVTQQFQDVEISMKSERGPVEVRQAYLSGRTLNIVASDTGGRTYTFLGTVAARRILGHVRIEGGDKAAGRIVRWKAGPGE